MKVKELSRGMKLKLQIAAALSHNAKLLILDEPTSGLDPAARDEICDLLRQFVADENKSVLFSTHICSDLEKTADYITFIFIFNICTILFFFGLSSIAMFIMRMITSDIDTIDGSFLFVLANCMIFLFIEMLTLPLLFKYNYTKARILTMLPIAMYTPVFMVFNKREF